MSVNEHRVVIMNTAMYGLNAWTDEPIVRTKHAHPYSYEPFTVFGANCPCESTGNAYSDRLMQWDRDKYKRCCKAVWGDEGQCFENRSPKSIEKFLQQYYEDESIELLWIVQDCNVSNGYPVWYFQWMVSGKCICTEEGSKDESA